MDLSSFIHKMQDDIEKEIQKSSPPLVVEEDEGANSRLSKVYPLIFIKQVKSIFGAPFYVPPELGSHSR